MNLPELDANFYSGPIRNHAANLAVLLPNSSSSSSLHMQLGHEKTAYMRNSPSMKALESMLNSKKRPQIADTIAEEPRTPPAPPAPPVAQPEPPADSSSVQSFQTASSVDLSPSKHTAKSGRTDGTSSTYDETPELVLHAQFHTVKPTTKDFSPSLRAIPAFQNEAYSDHDDTLIENEHKPTRLMIPDDIVVEKETRPAQKSREVEDSKKNGQETTASTPKAGVAASATLPDLQKHRSGSSFSLALKNKEQPALPNRHRRSSTLSDLTQKYFVKEERKQAKERETSGKKQSMESQTPKKGQAKSKRFSFMGLFKKKEPQVLPASASSPALVPTPNKSARTSMFKRSKSTDTVNQLNVAKDESKRREMGRREKEREQEKRNRERKRQEKEAGTKETSLEKKTTPHAPSSRPEEFLHSSDTLAQVALQPTKIASPTINPPSTLPVGLSAPRLPALAAAPDLPKPPVAGLIREVSDYELNETYALSDPDDMYDADNLSEDPATPYQPGRYDEEMKLEAGFGSPFEVAYSPDAVKLEKIGTEIETKIPAKEAEAGPSKEATKEATHSDHDQLLGETLFPRSLSAQEVHSIVSLERLRSIRSVRSKRNSFVNYNGSDDNVVQYNGSISVPTSGMTRSDSILKRLREGVKEDLRKGQEAQRLKESFLSPRGEQRGLQSSRESHAGYLSPYRASGSVTPDGDLANFAEFSDFLDFDNIDFQLSPLGVGTPESRSPVGVAEPEVVPRVEKVETVQVVDGEEKTQSMAVQKESDTASESEPGSRESHQSSSQVRGSPQVDPNHLVQDRQDPSAALSPPNAPRLHFSGPSVVVTSSPDAHEYTGPLTPNLETIDKFNSPVERAQPSAARPISMSFRGVRGPNFGEKLTMHEVRSSESHQLFNISFGDDLTELAAGGGFGDLDDSDESDGLDSEFAPEASSLPELPLTPQQLRQAPLQEPRVPFSAHRSLENKENIPVVPAAGTKPLFLHRRMSLWATDPLASPSLMNLFISRTFKRLPKVAVESVSAPEVRFSSRIILYDTYNGDDYDRHPDTATCNQLTPALAQMIRNEINEVKREMEVHRDLQCYTHFF